MHPVPRPNVSYLTALLQKYDSPFAMDIKRKMTLTIGEYRSFELGDNVAVWGFVMAVAYIAEDWLKVVAKPDWLVITVKPH